MTSYADFLSRKAIVDPPTGIEFEKSALLPALYDFQRDLVWWALRRGRAALFCDCGLGKTPMQLEWAHHIPGRVLILAPLAVAAQTVREAAKFHIGDIAYARHQDETDARIVVTNYEMLQHFEPDEFHGVVLDECFAAGTEIDTPDGKKHIEDIREGDCIWNAAGVDRVSDVHRREVQYAVKVTVNSSVFIASPNHPIFTQRGWVGAQHLCPGDYALETAAALRMVRGDVQSTVSVPVQATFLRTVLLSEMADESAGAFGQSAYAGSCSETRIEEVCVAEVWQSDSACRVRKASRVEVTITPGSEGENLPPTIESHEASTFRAWGQRSWFDETAADFAVCTFRELGGGICLVTGPTATGIPDALQTRLGRSNAKPLHRSGWRNTPEQASNRREEELETGFAWVESIEILEQGHPELERLRDAGGKLYFYDLGATRHPSYSVGGCLVHNSGILKAYDGKTRTLLIDAFRQTPFRLACTATPAPNDYMELGNHAEFLGVSTRAEMLAMFFVHDGGETQKWRLKGHAEAEFWRWLCSWAVTLRKPSDLGYEDGDFILPELVMHQVTIKVEDPGEGELFPIEAHTLLERLRARRDTLIERVTDCAKIVNATAEPFLIWTNLNAEADALVRMIPGAVQVSGSDSIDFKETTMRDFSDGRLRVLVSKPSICGHGLNWQHCAHQAFVGLSDSYEQFYQAIRRSWRFGQTRPVNVYVITAETEGAVVANIKRKEQDAMRMAESMVEHMKDLNQEALKGATMRGKESYAPTVEMIIPEWLRTA